MEEINENITCFVCGGANFYKESGFYFCNECQTQTQEIQEQVFDEFDGKQEQKASRKINTKPDAQANKVKLTTWECYNYVLKGLTDELITLGANSMLRTVVKKLWMKYLLKIEVVNMDKPKLQAVNTKIDAEIIYGKKKKRKVRRSRSSKISDSDLGSLDSKSLSRERIKRRKALVEAQYNHSLSKSMESTLLNETITSLKTNSEHSSQSSIPLKFNEFAKKELRKKQSDTHFNAHLEDFDCILSCHQNSYNEVSKPYQTSPYLLSINKLYSILNLGLLLTKSKIQLSDMLRFIREGHLSFNSFKHFFPDEMNDNFLTQVFPRKSCLLASSLRKSTFQIAKFLDVLDYIEVQNLVSLTEKFCTELNLPLSIQERVVNTLLISSPKMPILTKMKSFPNYEARALSFILFQLKLLFGIDGKTEKYLSNCAQDFNKSNMSLEMFDFMKWLQYLDYRSYVLQNLHFPSQFSSDKQFKNGHHFVEFILFKSPDYEKLDPCRKYNKSADDCRQLLIKLKNMQENLEDPEYFQPSLTPSIDYTEKLLRNRLTETEKQILKKKFVDCSIGHITDFINVVPLLNTKKTFKTKLRGANTNIKLFKLINHDNLVSNQLKKGRLFSLVTIKTLDDNTSEANASINSANTTIKVEETEEYINDFMDNHNLTQKTIEQQKRFNTISDLSSNDSEINEQTTHIHYRPQEFYWVYTDCNLGRLSKIKFQEHLSNYPSNFQFILKEMARISEQNVQDILYEFSLTEIYLLYNEKFENPENVNVDNVFYDKAMLRLIRRAKKNW